MRVQYIRYADKRRVRLSYRIHKDRRKSCYPARRTLCTPTWSHRDSHARTVRICRMQVNWETEIKLALRYRINYVTTKKIKTTTSKRTLEFK